MFNLSELRQIDLNLLVVFAALMEEGGVTAAGKRLFLTPSAVSMALSRLRGVAGDVLFVRQGRKMVPTPRAQEMYRRLQPALMQIEASLQREEFVPKRATGTVFLGMPDDMEISLIPKLARRLRGAAPNLNVSVVRADLYSVAQALLAQRVELAVSHYGPLPSWVERQVLGSTGFQVVMHVNSACARRFASSSSEGGLTITETGQWREAYLRCEHLLVSFSGERRGLVDEALDVKGLSRRVALVTPHFSAIPFLLKGAPLVATVPSYVAASLVASGELVCLPLPISVPRFEISIVWHKRSAEQPRHRWLREQISEVWAEHLQAQAR